MIMSEIMCMHVGGGLSEFLFQYCSKPDDGTSIFSRQLTGKLRSGQLIHKSVLESLAVLMSVLVETDVPYQTV